MQFLDIKKAFDSNSHNKLLKKLDYYGNRGVADLLLKSYFYRKRYGLIDNHKSSEKIIEYGISQGSWPPTLSGLCELPTFLSRNSISVFC